MIKQRIIVKAFAGENTPGVDMQREYWPFYRSHNSVGNRAGGEAAGLIVRRSLIKHSGGSG